MHARPDVGKQFTSHATISYNSSSGKLQTVVTLLISFPDDVVSAGSLSLFIERLE